MPSNEVGVIGGAVGGSLLKLAPMTGPAAPFVAIAGGLVELGSAIASALGVGSGCGQTCIDASNFANQIEPYLKQNRDAWLGLPQGLQTVSNQQLAVANFNNGWGELVQSCSAPALGNAGKRCVSDRSRGGKWDWFSYYLDPITNVVPVDINASQTTQILDTSLVGGSDITLGLVLGLGILLLGISE